MPTLVLPVAIGASMADLAYALRTLPGTAYAVWVGIAASLTVAYGVRTGDEPISIADTDHPVRRGVEAATFTTRQPRIAGLCAAHRPSA